MSYLLFPIYLLLFSWLTTKISFLKIKKVDRRILLLLFLSKVVSGVIYGIILSSPRYYQMSDTFWFHDESLKETQLLFHKPGEYFINLFVNPYKNGYQKFFSTSDSYWNDLKSNFVIKLLSLFNIFTFGNYYTNVILFSFLTFFGTVAFVKTMIKVFPGSEYLITAAIALIPSFAFWCNGIHKDGLIFTAISLFIYHFYTAARETGFTVEKVLFILFSLLLILPLRNSLFIGILPAAIAWGMAEVFPRRKIQVFGGVILLAVILFFSSKYLNPSLDLPASIAFKQQEFSKLKGRSQIPLSSLEPSFSGFVHTLPEALNHSFFRPYLTEAKNLLYIPAAFEVITFWLLTLAVLFFGKKNFKIDSTVLFCWMLSLIVLLVIGYTVPSLGAIERYRSLVLPFLIIPLLCLIDMKKIRTVFKKEKLAVTSAGSNNDPSF